VLHLQARIHLQEVIAAIRSEHELHRARTDIACRFRNGTGICTHPRPQLVVDNGARCFLDDFLMATLDAALALTEMHDVAMRIRQHLDLDMPRFNDQLFQIHGVIAKRTSGFASRCSNCSGEFALLIHRAHPFATTASAGLHHHRIAQLSRCGQELVITGIHALEPRHHWRTRLPRSFPRFDLQPHRANRSRWWADPRQASSGDSLGKPSVFSEESIARMHRIAAQLPRHGDDLLLVEVALGRRRRTQQARLVRQANMERPGIRLAVDRDRLATELAAPPDYAASNLAAVGDEYAVEHRPYCTAISSQPSA
jgi:hypothetical protein